LDCQSLSTPDCLGQNPGHEHSKAGDPTKKEESHRKHSMRSFFDEDNHSAFDPVGWSGRLIQSADPVR